MFHRAQDPREPRATERGGASGEDGDAERREPHRLCPAGEAHREFQRVPLCPPESSMLLVQRIDFIHALHSHDLIREAKIHSHLLE